MSYNFEKRFIDLALSSLGIVLLSPILIFVSVLIYLDYPGPIFYRPNRLGKNLVVFKIFKFRSMIPNAPDIRNSDGSTFNSEDDPRVTKFGRFMRKTSIDELPQLFNVFIGEMSLVGPRPDPEDAVNFYRKADFLRLTVPQGITGWAQVNGRNGIAWEKRRDLDLEYVRIKTTLLDLKIMIQTFLVIFKKSNINHR